MENVEKWRPLSSALLIAGLFFCFEWYFRAMTFTFRYRCSYRDTQTTTNKKYFYAIYTVCGHKLHFSIHRKGAKDAKDAKKTTLLWRLISLPEIMHIRLKQVGALKNDPEHIRYPRTLVIFSIFSGIIQ